MTSLCCMPRVWRWWRVLGISSGGFGGLWHMMDQRLHLGCSFLQLAGLGSTDLRKYTVLVLPPSGDAQSMLGVLGKGGVAKLRAWVEGGGTLIGVGGASTFLADTAAGLSTVRLRTQALKELDLYARATDLAVKAENPVIDSVALWSGRQAVDTMKSARTPANEKELALTDERGRLFMPRGALLRVELDKEHWLSFGAGDQLAAVMFTSSVFLARDPVRTPARFCGTGRAPSLRSSLARSARPLGPLGVRHAGVQRKRTDHSVRRRAGVPWLFPRDGTASDQRDTARVLDGVRSNSEFRTRRKSAIWDLLELGVHHPGDLHRYSLAPDSDWWRAPGWAPCDGPSLCRQVTGRRMARIRQKSYEGPEQGATRVTQTDQTSIIHG